MGERRRKRSATERLVDTAALPVKATGAMVTGVQTTRERLNAWLLPWAWRVGWLGMSGLAVCAGLAVIDEDHWPDGLDPDLLPYYTVVCLVAASLIGWGCMQLGVRRVRGLVGQRLGGWLFVLAPLACALLVLLQVRELIDMTTWPGGDALVPFTRWYPPALVGLGLVSYLTRRVGDDRQPGRLERGAWLLLLVAPYAVITAHVVGRLDVPWLADSLQDTLDELGTAALVVQLVLAYFVSSSAAGS